MAVQIFTCQINVVGPLREFLEAVDVEGNGLMRWFFAKWLKQMPARDKARRRNLEAMGKDVGDDPATDMPSYEGSTPQSKSPVENFISGDNPIIVVMGVLGVFVAIQIALHPR